MPPSRLRRARSSCASTPAPPCAPDYVERCVEALQRLGSRHRRWADALRGPRPEPARHRGGHDLSPRRRPGGVPARGWGRRAVSTPSTWVLFAQRPSRASAATTSGQGATKTPSSPGGPNSSAGSTSTRRSSPSISAARGWVLLRASSTATAPTGPGRFASIPASLSYRQLAVPALFVGLASPWRRPVLAAYLAVVLGRGALELTRDPAAAPTLRGSACPRCTPPGVWASCGACSEGRGAGTSRHRLRAYADERRRSTRHR